MILHMQAAQAAKIGTATTVGATVTSFIATALPIVQFAAACIGALVGCATLVYYILQIKKQLK